MGRHRTRYRTRSEQNRKPENKRPKPVPVGVAISRKLARVVVYAAAATLATSQFSKLHQYLSPEIIRPTQLKKGDQSDKANMKNIHQGKLSNPKKQKTPPPIIPIQSKKKQESSYHFIKFIARNSISKTLSDQQ